MGPTFSHLARWSTPSAVVSCQRTQLQRRCAAAGSGASLAHASLMSSRIVEFTSSNGTARRHVQTCSRWLWRDSKRHQRVFCYKTKINSLLASEIVLSAFELVDPTNGYFTTIPLYHIIIIIIIFICSDKNT